MPPDPAMGGMPPDPAMGGAPPGGGQMLAVSLEDLMMMFDQIVQERGGAGGGEPGMEGPNEGEEPTTTNKQIGARIDALDEKLDMLLQALGGGMPPGGEMGMPPGAEGGMPPGGDIPPELMAAMGGAMPPDAGGMPPAEMGGPLPPEAVAGAAPPMLPGGTGGMPVMASGNGGMKKAAAMSISKLVTQLRR